MSVRIAILVHEYDDFSDSPYFLREMCEIWAEKGFNISVSKGVKNFVDADLAILHVDLTKVPQEYLELASRYPRVVNGRIADISKRIVSSNLVSREARSTGPVIVKTDRNYGGQPEALLAKKIANAAPAKGNVSEAKRNWQNTEQIGSLNYPIFRSIGDVPSGVWDNPNLVVERFLPERLANEFLLRVWIFMGDKETHRICYSDHPIVKAANIKRKEVGPEVPEELRAMRRSLGFDFGKFDYAIVDGRIVLFDANRTPSLGNATKEQMLPNLHILAGGIDSLL